MSRKYSTLHRDCNALSCWQLRICRVFIVRMLMFRPFPVSSITISTGMKY